MCLRSNQRLHLLITNDTQWPNKELRPLFHCLHGSVAVRRTTGGIVPRPDQRFQLDETRPLSRRPGQFTTQELSIESLSWLMLCKLLVARILQFFPIVETEPLT